MLSLELTCSQSAYGKGLLWHRRFEVRSLKLSLQIDRNIVGKRSDLSTIWLVRILVTTKK